MGMSSMDPRGLDELLQRASQDKDVLAVIIFGSYARGEDYSDIDICLVMRPGQYEEVFLSRKRLDYLSLVGEGLDVQVFQALPIYVRVRVLRDGKIRLCKDEQVLYDIAFQTVKEFERFKPMYLEYLEGVSGAG